jgi:hypothetical protein
VTIPRIDDTRPPPSLETPPTEDSNTVYMERALAALRADRSIEDDLVAHLSPLSWEHIHLKGDYVWHANKRVAKGRFRPLRRSSTPSFEA